jgi:hypothetical protein
MLTYNHIYSKRDSIEKLRQEYAKDVSSIDIVKNEGCVAQIRMNIIVYNDVYLPVTDECYHDVFTNGSYTLTDVNLRTLSYQDRRTRTTLINKLISQIMSCIESGP